MEPLFAIDLLGGRCVRLLRGDFSRVSDYGDPLERAAQLVEAGARWLHVVDLDAARTGRPANLGTVRALASCGAAVQAGGGVRDAGSARALLDAGVRRVVVGTAALERPGLVEELAARWPGQVAVGLDHRGGQLATRGWARAAGARLEDALGWLEAAGAAAVVVTDISRDGTLGGPDLEGMARVLRATAVPVVASGGVSGAEDLRALAGLEAGGRRLAGVVVGKAVHEGALGVAEALAACGS
ncbi:MAG TPA: HisA/HisF-related TIM barrel protein [Acidimicrobiales bacterium]|jgi:phosphoribosylformimino-5-aminoimidazole carboxamide ribotide isomerase|nr:HisA/HisF-related TIM barrel protein [Acidimicrobiales bacterium]